MSFHCQTVAFKSYDGSAQNADKENFRFSLTLQAWGYDPAKLLFYFLSQMSKQKSSDLAWEDRAAPSSAAALSSCKIFWVSHTFFALEVFLATQVSLISTLDIEVASVIKFLEGSGARCKFLYDWVGNWVLPIEHKGNLPSREVSLLAGGWPSEGFRPSPASRASPLPGRLPLCSVGRTQIPQSIKFTLPSLIR